MFVILSVIYRPVEQLLSRTIADRRARGLHGHPLRVPALIQIGFALLFLVVALALRAADREQPVRRLERALLDPRDRRARVRGELLRARLARRPPALRPVRRARVPRVDLALPVRARRRRRDRLRPERGRARDGGRAVRLAVGDPVRVLAGPAPRRLRPGCPTADAAREGPAHAAVEEAAADLSLKYGTGFAVAVVGIMLAEQTLMNAAVLIVNHDLRRGALAGFVFNVLLIVRAPLQLFQAIQTSILPHLAGLEARESRAREFHRAIRLTVRAIAALRRRRRDSGCC